MAAAQNSTPQSPAGKPARSLLIGATLLAVATVLAAWQETTAAAEKQEEPTRPCMILLDARVVTMKPRDRSMLGTWREVTLHDDESAVSPEAGTRRIKSNRPIKAQVFTTDDLRATECLLDKVKDLEEDGYLHVVTNPQVIVKDGGEAFLIPIRDEWFFFLGPQPNSNYYVTGGEIYVCPRMSMTLHVGDGNDIAVATAFEVSNRDEIRHLNHPGTDVVAQRTETYTVTLQSGETAAWTGLVQCDPKNERPSGLGRLPFVGGLFRGHQAAKRTKETVIFVTAYLIPESPLIVTPARQ